MMQGMQRFPDGVGLSWLLASIYRDVSCAAILFEQIVN